MRSDHLNSDAVTYVATIEAQLEGAAAIAANLESAESPLALAVSLFERGPDRAEVSAYYAEKPSRELLIQLIERTVGNEDLGGFRIELLPPKNWVAEAESLRGPVRAGRFLVHGAHDRGKVPAGRFTLEIDAGHAFGTAHHATTRGCLLALDHLLKRERPPASSISAPAPASSPSPPREALQRTRAGERQGPDCRRRCVGKCERRTSVESALGCCMRRLRPSELRARRPIFCSPTLLCRALDLAPELLRRAPARRHVRPFRPSRAPGAHNRSAHFVLRLHPQIANPSRWMDHLLSRVAATAHGPAIDCARAKPYKAGPCIRASRRSAPLAPSGSGSRRSAGAAIAEAQGLSRAA